MIRLVCSEGKIAEDNEITKYMASVASRAISEAIEELCGNAEDTEKFLDASYGEEFFTGVGHYFKSDDQTVGYTIFKDKIARMLEKLSDTSEVYTFDLIEERIFYDIICELKGQMEINAEIGVENHNERNEEAVTKVLMKKFDYSEEDAKSLTRTLTCVAMMDEEEGDDTNLFFWDSDYLSFFENGFEEGIRAISKAETFGYGYDYVIQMFADIDLKVPMLWIGSREANRIEQEYVNSSEAIAKRLDDMMNGKE